MKKTCLQCGKEMLKSQNRSVRSWIEQAKFCSRACRFVAQKGKKLSLITRGKMSISHMGNKSHTGKVFSKEHLRKMSEAFTGPKHPNWKGGITPRNHLIRNSAKFKEWRKAVFERDSYTCKISNGDCVHEIHAHHILRFAEYPELRFELTNGITLCKNHHPLKRSHEKELEPFFKQLIWQHSSQT